MCVHTWFGGESGTTYEVGRLVTDDMTNRVAWICGRTVLITTSDLAGCKWQGSCRWRAVTIAYMRTVQVSTGTELERFEDHYEGNHSNLCATGRPEMQSAHQAKVGAGNAPTFGTDPCRVLVDRAETSRQSHLTGQLVSIHGHE